VASLEQSTGYEGKQEGLLNPFGVT
jgi:hypothetical protein